MYYTITTFPSQVVQQPETVVLIILAVY